MLRHASGPIGKATAMLTGEHRARSDGRSGFEIATGWLALTDQAIVVKPQLF